MTRNILAIPFLTIFLVLAVFLNIPVFREIIAFIYLTFVPGYVILKLFNLKQLSLLRTFLLSVALSLLATMFVGLIVNELFIFAGLQNPLSAIPLTFAMVAFTIILFLFSYKGSLSLNSFSLSEFSKLKGRFLPFSIVIVLPIISIIGALYANVILMIVSCIAIILVCIVTVVFKKFIPSELYPLIIFAVSISILLSTIMMSKYIIGDDANLEFYIFKITQLRGFWGPINTVIDYTPAFFYNSMLSVTILPNVYSAIMGIHDELLFKILYPFVFSLLPLALFDLYKNSVSKMICVLSVFVFIFSTGAFFGELLTVNRQIIAEFFLVLSTVLWLDKTMAIREKRLLLIIFGVSMALSHYSIALLYIAFISFVFIVSRVKPKFDITYNSSTVLSIIVLTLSWFIFTASPILVPIVETLQGSLNNLFTFSSGGGSAGAVSALPQVFTIASWYNLAISLTINLLIVLGVVSFVILSKRLSISSKYKFIIICSAIILAASLLFPSLARTLNFTRFYAVSLLFLSPCVVVGALSVLELILSLTKRNSARVLNFLTKDSKVMIIIAIFLGAYFISQSGFANYAFDGAIHSQTFDYYKILQTDEPQFVVQFYGRYIHERDAFSADWLFINGNSTVIYAAPSFNNYPLVSRGLIPMNFVYPLTNETYPEQSSLIYLNSMNMVKGIFPSLQGFYRISEISNQTDSFSKSNLIYSNGGSAILYAVK